MEVEVRCVDGSVYLTSKVGGRHDVESDRGGGTGVRRADGWDNQVGSSPSWRFVTGSSGENGESASVGPGKVFRA